MRNNWGSLMDNYGCILFTRYPDIFPDVKNVLHINDQYYCRGIQLENDYIGLMSSELFDITTDEKIYDFMGGLLESDGMVYLTWD